MRTLSQVGTEYWFNAWSELMAELSLSRLQVGARTTPQPAAIRYEMPGTRVLPGFAIRSSPSAAPGDRCGSPSGCSPYGALAGTRLVLAPSRRPLLGDCCTDPHPLGATPQRRRHRLVPRARCQSLALVFGYGVRRSTAVRCWLSEWGLPARSLPVISPINDGTTDSLKHKLYCCNNRVVPFLFRR